MGEIIPFPRNKVNYATGKSGYDSWIIFVETELLTLGYNLDGTSIFGFPTSNQSYDWKEDYDNGLDAKTSAEKAVLVFALLGD